MMTTSFIGYLVGAIGMGMSCGTGCSPIISMFLTSYVFHAQGNTKKSILAFVNFFVGKAMAVLLVCIASSFVGSALLDQNGYWGKYKITFVMPVFMICTGIYMLKKCWTEYRKGACGHCSDGCSMKSQQMQSLSPLIGGFLYGITPCAPLVILAGYAVTMPIIEALIIGVVFGIACTISPLIFMMAFMKLIAMKMYQEVPAFFKFTKAILSVGVLVLGCATLIVKN